MGSDEDGRLNNEEYVKMGNRGGVFGRNDIGEGGYYVRITNRGRGRENIMKV